MLHARESAQASGPAFLISVRGTCVSWCKLAQMPISSDRMMWREDRTLENPASQGPIPFASERLQHVLQRLGVPSDQDCLHGDRLTEQLGRRFDGERCRPRRIGYSNSAECISYSERRIG